MIKNIIKYRYLILIGSFFLWISFFDSSNLLFIRELKKEKKSLKTEKNYYVNEINEAKNLRDDLFGSKENLEKFARETYLMKKDEEDIFLIIEDQKE